MQIIKDFPYIYLNGHFKQCYIAFFFNTWPYIFNTLNVLSSKINLKTKQKQNSISERYRMIHNEYFFSRDKKYEISSMDPVKYMFTNSSLTI